MLIIIFYCNTLLITAINKLLFFSIIIVLLLFINIEKCDYVISDEASLFGVKFPLTQDNNFYSDKSGKNIFLKSVLHNSTSTGIPLDNKGINVTLDSKNVTSSTRSNIIVTSKQPTMKSMQITSVEKSTRRSSYHSTILSTERSTKNTIIYLGNTTVTSGNRVIAQTTTRKQKHYNWLGQEVPMLYKNYSESYDMYDSDYEAIDMGFTSKDETTVKPFVADWLGIQSLNEGNNNSIAALRAPHQICITNSGSGNNNNKSSSSISTVKTTPNSKVLTSKVSSKVESTTKSIKKCTTKKKEETNSMSTSATTISTAATTTTGISTTNIVTKSTTLTSKAMPSTQLTTLTTQTSTETTSTTETSGSTLITSSTTLLPTTCVLVYLSDLTTFGSEETSISDTSTHESQITSSILPMETTDEQSSSTDLASTCSGSTSTELCRCNKSPFKNFLHNVKDNSKQFVQKLNQTYLYRKMFLGPDVCNSKNTNKTTVRPKTAPADESYEDIIEDKNDDNNNVTKIRYDQKHLQPSSTTEIFETNSVDNISETSASAIPTTISVSNDSHFKDFILLNMKNNWFVHQLNKTFSFRNDSARNFKKKVLYPKLVSSSTEAVIEVDTVPQIFSEINLIEGGTKLIETYSTPEKFSTCIATSSVCSTTPKLCKCTTKRCTKRTTRCTKRTTRCTKRTTRCTKRTTRCTKRTTRCAKRTTRCTKHTTRCTKHTTCCTKRTSRCTKRSTPFRCKIHTTTSCTKRSTPTSTKYRFTCKQNKKDKFLNRFKKPKTKPCEEDLICDSNDRLTSVITDASNISDTTTSDDNGVNEAIEPNNPEMTTLIDDFTTANDNLTSFTITPRIQCGLTPKMNMSWQNYSYMVRPDQLPFINGSNGTVHGNTDVFNVAGRFVTNCLGQMSKMVHCFAPGDPPLPTIDNITFFLFTRKNRNKAEILSLDKASLVRSNWNWAGGNGAGTGSDGFDMDEDVVYDDDDEDNYVLYSYYSWNDDSEKMFSKRDADIPIPFFPQHNKCNESDKNKTNNFNLDDSNNLNYDSGKIFEDLISSMNNENHENIANVNSDERNSMNNNNYINNRPYKENNHSSCKQFNCGKSIIASKYFNFEEKTKIIIHGYTQSLTSEAIMELKDVYLAQGSYNIIIVDWSDLAAGPCYNIASKYAKYVGSLVSELVAQLAVGGITMKSVHIIGFSLGAQVAGLAGSNFATGHIERITGLDPALPLFSKRVSGSSLDSGDAHFVDVIHTSHVLGQSHPLGHADFYPNGGTRQPGCDKPDIICSHVRGLLLFIESVKSAGAFPSVLCDSWESYESGRCRENNTIIAFMGDPCLSNASGKFFLRTSSASPYSLKVKKT